VDLLIQSLREVVVDDGSPGALKVQLLIGKPYERPITTHRDVWVWRAAFALMALGTGLQLLGAILSP